ncbi:MAG: 30S ribosomal protein S24e [Candidatus Bathyarchaeota archaeon]|jgi:small subunit ribosomal protein S24e
MEIKIVSQKYNPLLKRKEVVFKVEHEKVGGTPPRLEIRAKLAQMLKMKLEQVYVRKVETKTGMRIALGEASGYDTVEQAILIEPKYVIERNTPKEKAEEAERPKKAEKPKKPEKPAEEAKEVKEAEETEEAEKVETAEKAENSDETKQPKEKEE